MNNEQLQRAKEIEKSLEVAAKHKTSVNLFFEKFECSNPPVLLLKQDHISTVTLVSDLLPMKPDVLLKIYLSALELEMDKLTKELEQL